MRDYRALCYGIIYRAVLDIENKALMTSPDDVKIATAFVHSEYCQSMCDYAGIDYFKVLKKAVPPHGNGGAKGGCFKPD
jgi:hypothetical protein